MIKAQRISTLYFLLLLQQFLFSLSSSSPDSKSMVGQQQHENQQQDQQDVEFQEMGFNNNGVHVQWVIMEPQNQDNTSESESVSSIGEDSGNNSGASTSSSELEEDASSSSSSTEFGPLYELSDLMNQLPIKRGLSKNYQGKSQSFTSLANVKSLEDLAKKVGPYSHRMKSCKSYAGGLDAHKFGPKATIAKKRGSSSSSSSFASLRKGTLVGSFRRPVGLQQRDY